MRAKIFLSFIFPALGITLVMHIRYSQIFVEGRKEKRFLDRVLIFK